MTDCSGQHPVPPVTGRVIWERYSALGFSRCSDMGTGAFGPLGSKELLSALSPKHFQTRRAVCERNSSLLSRLDPGQDAGLRCPLLVGVWRSPSALPSSRVTRVGTKVTR